MAKYYPMYVGPGADSGGYGRGDFKYSGDLSGMYDSEYWRNAAYNADAYNRRTYGQSEPASGKGNVFNKMGNLFDPTLKNRFKGFGSKLTNPNFNYDMKTGVQGWGKNLGGLYNIGNVAVQGYNALQGLDEMSELRDDTDDLISDIVTSSYNSPTLQYDLNSEQLKLLRELRNDRYNTDVDFGDLDLLGILADFGKGALTGAPGGIYGALIGGVGSALNSGIEDLQGGISADNAELQALYDAILNSEQQYKQLEKQKAYARLYG